jgi:hypothetical protein
LGGQTTLFKKALKDSKSGSERETVTLPDGMGVLIFGDSG